MRSMPAVALAVMAASCGRSQPERPPTPSQCVYEIVQPDTSQTADAFRAWLKPQADALFGRDEVVNGDVFMADLNNDGTGELLFAWHEGSGSYLNVLVYRRAGDTWSQVEPLPFEDRLQAAHEYSGPLMTEPQLVGRLCGKTIINLMGGIEPNYYPDSFIWEGNTTKPICSAPWLTRHRAAAADLVKRGMLDEARVLLSGVRKGCEKESAAEVRAIDEDGAGIARTTAAASAASYDFSWLMSEVKKNPDGQLVRDPRFGAMLVTIVPDAQLEQESLRGALKKSVWLPDDPKIIDDRYIVISGCEPHNCGNRGLVWIDIATKQAIAMTGGVLASKTTDPSKIPTAFWEQTLEAVGDWPDEGIDFIGADGKTTAVKKP
jgi:hypothetical protein